MNVNEMQAKIDLIVALGKKGDELLAEINSHENNYPEKPTSGKLSDALLWVRQVNAWEDKENGLRIGMGCINTDIGVVVKDLVLAGVPLYVRVNSTDGQGIMLVEGKYLDYKVEWL